MAGNVRKYTKQLTLNAIVVNSQWKIHESYKQIANMDEWGTEWMSEWVNVNEWSLYVGSRRSIVNNVLRNFPISTTQTKNNLMKTSVCTFWKLQTNTNINLKLLYSELNNNEKERKRKIKLNLIGLTKCRSMWQQFHSIEDECLLKDRQTDRRWLAPSV